MGDPGPIYLSTAHSKLAGGTRIQDSGAAPSPSAAAALDRTYRFLVWQQSTFSDELEMSEDPTEAGGTDFGDMRQLPPTIQFTVRATGDDTFVEANGDAETLAGEGASAEERASRFRAQVEQMRALKGEPVTVTTRYLPSFEGVVRSVNIDDEGEWDDNVQITFEVRQPVESDGESAFLEEGVLLIPDLATVPPPPPEASGEAIETASAFLSTLRDDPKCIPTPSSKVGSWFKRRGKGFIEGVNNIGEFAVHVSKEAGRGFMDFTEDISENVGITALGATVGLITPRGQETCHIKEGKHKGTKGTRTKPSEELVVDGTLSGFVPAGDIRGVSLIPLKDADTTRVALDVTLGTGAMIDFGFQWNRKDKSYALDLILAYTTNNEDTTKRLYVEAGRPMFVKAFDIKPRDGNTDAMLVILHNKGDKSVPFDPSTADQFSLFITMGEDRR